MSKLYRNLRRNGLMVYMLLLIIIIYFKDKMIRDLVSSLRHTPSSFYLHSWSTMEEEEILKQHWLFEQKNKDLQKMEVLYITTFVLYYTIDIIICLRRDEVVIHQIPIRQ